MPPGCSSSDIERAANGSCPECGAILDDGKCPKCGWIDALVRCEECGGDEFIICECGKRLCPDCDQGNFRTHSDGMVECDECNPA